MRLTYPIKLSASLAIFEAMVDGIENLLRYDIPKLLDEFGHLDPSSIALKKNLPIEATVLADLVSAHKKAPLKFPTWYSRNWLLTKSETEQASGEFAAIHKARLIPEHSIADLTCALGFDSLAFLKAGKSVICSDVNPNMVPLAKFNHTISDALALHYSQGDAQTKWKEYVGKVDALYLDPMRRTGQQRLKEVSEFQPDIFSIVDSAITHFSSIWVKLSPLTDISFLENSFSSLSEIHVVSVHDECKEVLVRFQTNATVVKKLVHILDKMGNATSFSASLDDLEIPKTNISKKTFAIIPDAALRKWRLSSILAQKVSAELVHPNLDILISDTFLSFIGRHFEIFFHGDITLKSIHKTAKSLGITSASVDLHNVPFTEKVFRQKSKIPDGPDGHIILYTNAKKKLAAIVGKRFITE